MNEIGYPSSNMDNFFRYYYNKKFSKKIKYIKIRNKFASSAYLYFKLLFLFIFSFLFFKKPNNNKKYNIVHAFHSDSDFLNKPYRTTKTPPSEELINDSTLYHDVNLSFVSLNKLLEYKKHRITLSIRYLSIFTFIILHFTALKVYINSYKLFKLNFLNTSYCSILYILVKGYSIGSLINSLNKDSRYFNMWENRGYHHILDDIVINHEKNICLDVALIFRFSPQYTMLKTTRRELKSKILCMSKLNYDLVKNNLGNVNYNFFKNYRIDCENYNSKGKKNSILLLSPLSVDVSNTLYKLIIDNKNDALNIQIRLHPYLNKDNYDNKYIEDRNIYDSLDDYDTIVYAGITTASVELYFQGKNVYKFITDEFIDIDMLVDNNLVSKIKSLDEINNKINRYNKVDKNYYLGCNNKTLKEILEELDK
jgi:hypothetical protein